MRPRTPWENRYILTPLYIANISADGRLVDGAWAQAHGLTSVFGMLMLHEDRVSAHGSCWHRGNGSPLMSNWIRKGRAPCMCSLLMQSHRSNGGADSSCVASLKGPSQTDWSDQGRDENHQHDRREQALRKQWLAVE
jgi:hypothetical protein